VSSTHRSFPHTKKLLSLDRTSSRCPARSSKEKRSTKWIPSALIEEHLADDNTWSLGRDTLVPKILGNLSHIWFMHISFFEHTNWEDLRIFLRSHPSNLSMIPSDSPPSRSTILLRPRSCFRLKTVATVPQCAPCCTSAFSKIICFDTCLCSLRRGEPLTRARTSVRIPLESSSSLKGRRTNAAMHARPRTKRRVVSDEESITSPTTPPLSFSTFGSQLRLDFGIIHSGSFPGYRRPSFFNRRPNASWT